MRVTENTNYGLVRENIRRSKERMEGLQQQHSTMKKLNAPSDDPVGAAKVLEVRTDKLNNDQFQMDSKLAETFLTKTDHALGELSDIVVRAKEIALGQSSGASSNDDTRMGVSEEVTQLFLQAVSTANRRIGDRYLFGGYKTNQPPVNAEGRYVGDDNHMMVEVAKDVFVAMNVSGNEAFNTRPENSPERIAGQFGESETVVDAELKRELNTPSENVNLFDELQNLRVSLLTGDLDGVRNTLDRFDNMHARLVAMRSRIGSRIQGLTSSSQAIERHNLTNAQLTSTLEDADMSQIVSDLAKEETVFKSALSTSQKLIQPNLLDFLK